MWILAFIIGLGAMWDGFTTFVGIIQIFNITGMHGVELAQLIFAAVVSIVILGKSRRSPRARADRSAQIGP